MYLLEQHDGFGHYTTLALYEDRQTLENWKDFLQKQDRSSPAKRNGEFFEINSAIPQIWKGEPPSITGARGILRLTGQE